MKKRNDFGMKFIPPETKKHTTDSTEGQINENQAPNDRIEKVFERLLLILNCH